MILSSIAGVVPAVIDDGGDKSRTDDTHKNQNFAH